MVTCVTMRHLIKSLKAMCNYLQFIKLLIVRLLCKVDYNVRLTILYIISLKKFKFFFSLFSITEHYQITMQLETKFSVLEFVHINAQLNCFLWKSHLPFKEIVIVQGVNLKTVKTVLTDTAILRP